MSNETPEKPTSSVPVPVARASGTAANRRNALFGVFFVDSQARLGPSRHFPYLIPARERAAVPVLPAVSPFAWR